jgi:uncharacterized membrane protein
MWKPRGYTPFIPPALPPPEGFVDVPGVAELICAAGLLARTRWAGPASVAVLLGVFPGNVQMALDVTSAAQPGEGAKVAAVWARLPLQIPMIWAVLQNEPLREALSSGMRAGRAEDEPQAAGRARPAPADRRARAARDAGGLEALAVATVMPKVEADLGDRLYGWVFSAFFLGNLVGLVVAGQACDRMKPVIPFAVGLVLFMVGPLGGLAGSMGPLVAARCCGDGAGACQPWPAWPSVASTPRRPGPHVRPALDRMGGAVDRPRPGRGGRGAVRLALGLPGARAHRRSVRYRRAGLSGAHRCSGRSSRGGLEPADAADRAGAGWRCRPGRVGCVAGPPLLVVGLVVLVPVLRRLTPPGTLCLRGLAAAVLIRGSDVLVLPDVRAACMTSAKGCRRSSPAWC